MLRLFLRWMKYLSLLILFLFIIGALQHRPEDFMHFLLYIKVGLACYLLYRFSHMRRYSTFDRRIVYASAIFILLTSFIEYVNYVVDEVRKHVSVYTVPLLSQLVSILGI